jgi:GT2 family glycosyltransferase
MAIFMGLNGPGRGSVASSPQAADGADPQSAGDMRHESCDVVIVNYNAGALLAEGVRSLLGSRPGHIVVVDNASTDGSLIDLEKLSASAPITIIRNPGNLGFAAGCNIGAAASTAQAVLFLNPDCRMALGALEAMLDELFSDPQIGMVGPSVLNPDGSQQRGSRRKIPTPLSGFTRAFGITYLSRFWPGIFGDFNQHTDGLPSGPSDVEAISGSCMLVKREAMDKVGPWDEGYFLHCEDLDWCMRFSQAGWRIVFVPEAQAIHVGGASSRSRPIFVEWHKHQGMMRFYHKFYANKYPAPLLWLVGAGVWLRFGAIAAVHWFRNALGALRAGRAS